jgi:PAS domain-containing protein
VGAYLQDLQRHLSDLFKISMLWAPVGLVYTLGGYRQTLQVWMLAMVLTFGLLALPLFSGLKAGDVLEVICALVGTGVGSAIGARTRWSAGFSAKMAARTTATPQPAVDFRALAPALLRQTLALGLLLGVVLSLLDFPRLAPWLGAGLAAYSLLLWRFPYAWLLVMPAVLPILDFAPWTGRFFFDEFDRVMLVTLEQGRLRMEEALKASEVRYRRLFETAKDGILIGDLLEYEIAPRMERIIPLIEKGL